jgi:hypothetical protein
MTCLEPTTKVLSSKLRALVKSTRKVYNTGNSFERSQVLAAASLHRPLVNLPNPAKLRWGRRHALSQTLTGDDEARTITHGTRSPLTSDFPTRVPSYYPHSYNQLVDKLPLRNSDTFIHSMYQ